MHKQLPEGTIIGSVDCPGCGKKNIPLKVRASGLVSAFCAAPTARDEKGKVIDQCMSGVKIGRFGSKRLIDEFLAKEGLNNVEEPVNRETTRNTEQYRSEAEAGSAGDCSSPGGADGESRNPSGFGASLKHFLTATE